MKSITLTPIGTVHSTRRANEDDDWDKENVWVELDTSRFAPDSLAGLMDFSHVEIIFHMNQVEHAKIETSARHPRGNTAWPKVGIFAQRAKNRPNALGLTVCRILKVEGAKVHVEGLDAIDGTPVLDLKPWVDEFAPRGKVTQPRWITELMSKYWK